MKSIRRSLVIAVAIVAAGVLAGCGALPGEPPTYEDVQVQTYSAAVSEMALAEAPLEAYGLALGANSIALLANTVSAWALQDWDVESEETYVVASGGDAEVTVSWSTTETDWIWTLTWTVETVTHTATLVISQDPDDQSWSITLDYDDVEILGGWVSADGLTGSVVLSDTAGVIAYSAEWEPSANPLYDVLATISLLDGSGEVVELLILEFTQNGDAGRWEYYTDPSSEPTSGGFWPQAVD